MQYILINGHLGFEAKGIEGVGIAILISRTIEMLINVISCHSYHFSRYFFNSIKLDFQLLKNALNSTYPFSIPHLTFLGLHLQILFVSLLLLG